MNVPIEVWYSLGSIALTLLVSAAHRRGRRLPLVELILDAVHATPSSAITLDKVLDELRRRLPLPEEKK